MDFKLYFCPVMEWSYDTTNGYDDSEVYMEYGYVFVSSTGRNHSKIALTSLNDKNHHYLLTFYLKDSARKRATIWQLVNESLEVKCVTGWKPIITRQVLGINMPTKEGHCSYFDPYPESLFTKWRCLIKFPTSLEVLTSYRVNKFLTIYNPETIWNKQHIQINICTRSLLPGRYWSQLS